ncbi:pyridoxal phosphate-dependent aminotransferase [Marinomonas sp. 2405UD68-3]|uniref:pyridoxal phosphate-dependent aminotransferase n=1 Tax=Marinomonas sp. 2405UD68-3 TaxID=3391835 RepID=UPI0039C97133
MDYSLKKKLDFKRFFCPYLVKFDESGDGVYASKKAMPISMTLTTNPYGSSPTIETEPADKNISSYPFEQTKKLQKKIAEKLCGAAISYVSMENEIYLNLKQFKHVIRANTKIVYLCNPNNPTGEYLSPESIINNLYSDDYILIVDEANIEFGGESCAKYVSDFPNLIVLRTFSKAYGIANLRVGYAIASPEMLRLIDRSRPPFPVSGTACDAAIKAIDDSDFLVNSVAKIHAEKIRLSSYLEALNFTVIKGSANTLLCNNENVKELSEEFSNIGISVASGSAFGLKNHWCRIAPQQIHINNAFIEKIKEMECGSA